MEDTSTEQVKRHYFIDLDWYQPNSRSFSALAERCLCAKCRQQLNMKTGEIPAADLLAAIKDCCSSQPGFITGRLPVSECIFRLFLANGNQPLDLEEMAEQLSEWREGSLYRISAEVLSRILENDQYYGIRQVQS